MRRCAARRRHLAGHVGVGGRDVRHSEVEEQPARLAREAVVVRIAAGQPLVRVEVVVDARDFLPRVVDVGLRVEELQPCR